RNRLSVVAAGFRSGQRVPVTGGCLQIPARICSDRAEPSSSVKNRKKIVRVIRAGLRWLALQKPDPGEIEQLDINPDLKRRLAHRSVLAREIDEIVLPAQGKLRKLHA